MHLKTISGKTKQVDVIIVGSKSPYYIKMCNDDESHNAFPCVTDLSGFLPLFYW